MAKNTKISKSLLTAASLLANAYIAGRAGNKKRAGEYMVAACRTDDLDAVMHGIATAMGISDDDVDITTDDEGDISITETSTAGCDDEDMFADTEEEDMFADDDDSDNDDASGVYSDLTADDEEVFADDDDSDSDDASDDEKCPDCDSAPCECEEETVTKVAVPASCARLSRIRY